MWSFLANLGSGLGKIGSGFAHGAAGIGKGIGRGFKRLGQLGEGEDDLGPGGTPTFMPGAASQGGVRGIEDAVAGAENDARADFGAKPTPLLAGDMPDLPINRSAINIPSLTPAPAMADLRSALPSLPSRPSPPLITPAAPSAPVPDLIPDMDLDRRNVPIPRLPGQKGAPTPYNPIDAAKYESVMSHAKRDAEGNPLGKAEGGGFERDWKTIVRNALLGGSAAASSARPGEDPLGRAIGGAFTAGAGSAINPQAGYEFAFDVGERPKLEAEQARGRAEQDRQRIERAAAMDEAIKQAQVNRIPLETEKERAQIDQIRGNLDVARQNAERQKALTQSQIDLNKARADAARTGTPQKTDRVNLATGAIETVLVYPNGDERVVGRSAEAALAEWRDREAMKRTKYSESAATGRTAMGEAGAKERKQMEIDAEAKLAAGAGGSKLRNPSSGQAGQGGGATPEQIQRIISEAKKRGQTVTEEQVRARLKARGQ